MTRGIDVSIEYPLAREALRSGLLAIKECIWIDRDRLLDELDH